MICRNCCKEVSEDAPICTNCSFEPLAESNYCQECGASSKPNQKICIECGFELLNFNINATEYAGFFRRLGAFLIDSVVLVIIIFPIVFIISVIGAEMMLIGFYEDEIYDFIDMLVYIISAPIFWLYYAWMESSSKQGTLGKMALGIIVIDFDGKPISFARASGKHFGRYISASIFLLGYIIAAFTKRKQALHDIMAETYVIKKRKKDHSPYH